MIPHNTAEYIARRTSDCLVEFEHPSGVGTVLVGYDIGRRTLSLYDMNVVFVYRNQGVGKDMLHYVRYVAEQIGATTVAAVLNSREVYAAAVSVFGNDCMDVKQLGNFTEPTDGSVPGRPYSSNVVMRYDVAKT